MKYTEVLKEVQPGVFTHSHWVDEKGEEVVTPEQPKEKTIEERLQELQQQNVILMEALLEIGGMNG